MRESLLVSRRGGIDSGDDPPPLLGEHVISSVGSAMRILLAFPYHSFFSSDVDSTWVSAPTFSSDDVSGSDDNGTSFTSNASTWMGRHWQSADRREPRSRGSICEGL
jgi:hypothetical protein